MNFSIVIPTWNNLTYVRLCVESIRKHSRFEHEIILHVNDGDDGTLAWARETGLKHTHSPHNVGIPLAVNQAAGLATTDYIMFMNDDMYVCPRWDEELAMEIATLGHDLFSLSATMIEPAFSRNPCVLVARDFGDSVETFDEVALLAQCADFEFSDWWGATWPPNVVHRRYWHLVGGLSVEFSPGMYSDPDFSMKLWRAGVRYFKGVARSRVYHFQCKSTQRIVKNPGKQQFLRKWGLSPSTFDRYYLRRGQPFAGSLTEPRIPGRVRCKDRLRRFLA